MDSEPDELISRVNILARQIQHDLDLRLAPTRLNASNYYFILKLGSVDDKIGRASCRERVSSPV